MAPPTDFEAEWSVLTTPEGRDLLAEVSGIRRVVPADLARWRKVFAPDVVAAALRLAESRRKGLPKFSRANAMWLDPVGVEQSTAEVVARHKAARFAGARVVDLCSGIGGDALALGQVSDGPTWAVDADPGMARRTRWNAEVYGAHVFPIVARAERLTIPHGSLLHADPDRRHDRTTRARSIADYAPNLATLHGWMRSLKGGAFKLSAASDFDSSFPADKIEIEVISLHGECKEACIWFGSLATPGLRRSTLLPSGATWTGQSDSCTTPIRDEPGAWIFEADPSLVRLRLLDGFAEAHGLKRLGGSHDLLTGDAAVALPQLALFRSFFVGPFDRKRLRREVQARGLGPLEIKPRGVGVTPEALREELRAPGPTPATLFVVGEKGRPSLAILAERVSPAGPG